MKFMVLIKSSKRHNMPKIYTRGCTKTCEAPRSTESSQPNLWPTVSPFNDSYSVKPSRKLLPSSLHCSCISGSLRTLSEHFRLVVEPASDSNRPESSLQPALDRLSTTQNVLGSPTTDRVSYREKT